MKEMDGNGKYLLCYVNSWIIPLCRHCGTMQKALVTLTLPAKRLAPCGSFWTT